MVYNFKEYKPIFDTPMKRQQELAIARKIMDLLNKNKYNNLEEFIKRNDSYQNFLKNNHMDTVVKHFGNTLNEEDFKRILENLNVLTNTKQDFEKENIKTTNIDDKEYNSFKGENKTYFIDNSRTDKSIEEQMQDLQHTQQEFQTNDIKKNTENMFKELEKSKKESFKLQYLNEINVQELNYEERELFNIALLYQQDLNQVIRIDLKKQIIVDEEDNIMRIQKENGEFTIIKEENEKQQEETVEKVNQRQLTLKPNTNTIYSNN